VRDFSEAWLDDYVAQAGAALTETVGGYELEGLGVQLFERVEGDYFAILGLPLIELLEALRRFGALPG
jgi:septum formation protein